MSIHVSRYACMWLRLIVICDRGHQCSFVMNGPVSLIICITIPTNKTLKMAQHIMHANDRDAITKVTPFLVLRIQKSTLLEYTVNVTFCDNKIILCL